MYGIYTVFLLTYAVYQLEHSLATLIYCIFTYTLHLHLLIYNVTLYLTQYIYVHGSSCLF